MGRKLLKIKPIKYFDAIGLKSNKQISESVNS